MKNYTVKETHNSITISGDKGTFAHNYSEHSARTRIYREFIAKVLHAYGTQAINDILYYENH